MLQRAHERALDEEVHGAEPASNDFPIRAELVRLGFEEELLQCGVELADGLFFVDSRIALKSFHDRVKGKCHGLRKLRLTAAWRPFDQNRLLELSRHVNLGERDFINDVLGIPEFLAEFSNRRKHVGSSARILREDVFFTEKSDGSASGKRLTAWLD